MLLFDESNLILFDFISATKLENSFLIRYGKKIIINRGINIAVKLQKNKVRSIHIILAFLISVYHLSSYLIKWYPSYTIRGMGRGIQWL